MIKTNHQIERRNAILDSAVQLLNKNPTATLDAIAMHANVGIATLHRYFKNRDYLLESIGFRAIELVDTALNQVSPAGRTTIAYFEAQIAAMIPLGDRVCFMVNGASLQSHLLLIAEEERIKGLFLPTIVQLKKEKIIQENLTSEWVIEISYALIIVAWEQIYKGILAPKMATDLVLQTLLRGVGRLKDEK